MESQHRVRLFTGISLTQEVRDYVTDIMKDLSNELKGMRWVPPENLHVTLKFLGNCEPAAVHAILNIMGGVSELLPLELEIGGAGGFPSQRSARVIWVGAGDTTGRLGEVFKRIDRGAERCGIAREKHGYRPHITVGRSKVGVSVPVESLHFNGAGMILEVEEITLFESVLSQAGAQYSIIGKVGPHGRPQH